MIEEGFAKHEVTRQIIDIYLQDMRKSGIDTLILGCTHYPLLRSDIHGYMGEEIHIVNPAYETAMDLKKMLAEEEMEKRDGTKAWYEFYSRDAPVKFKYCSNSILTCNINGKEHINLEPYLEKR